MPEFENCHGEIVVGGIALLCHRPKGHDSLCTAQTARANDGSWFALVRWGASEAFSAYVEECNRAAAH